MNNQKMANVRSFLGLVVTCRYLSSPIVTLALLALALPISVGRAQQTAADKREPASRAAVVLTWTQAQREAGFAGMETIFRTRTVRGSGKPHPLPNGRSLEAFAPGGLRADELERFVKEQKVAGLLVLHDGRVRLERDALTGGRQGRRP